MMAVMNPVPMINLPVDPTGYSFEGRRTAGVMTSSRREIVEEEEEDEIKIYVFLGIDPKEKLNLQWVIDNLKGNIIVVMHVHVKSQLIPVKGMGARLPPSSVSDLKAKAHWETEKQKTKRILKDYVSLCRKNGVQTEKHFHEANCIEKGILELISKHKIRKLVMGAAANKHYSKDMKELRSRKAIYVRDNAPAGCNIWFVCKGNLVQIREGSEAAENEAEFPSLPSTPQNGSGRKSTSRRGIFDKMWTVGHKSKKKDLLNSPSASPGDPPSLWSPKTRSINERLSNWFKGKSPSGGPDYSFDSVVDIPSVVTAITEEGQNRLMRNSPSRNSDSSYSTVVDTFSVITATTEEGHSGLLASTSPEYKEDPCQPSPSGRHVSTATEFKEDLSRASPSSVLVRNLYDAVDHQLHQPEVAVENARHNEPLRRAVIQNKPEQDMMGAIYMANTFQMLYNEELHRRKEVEEALRKEKDECETMRKQLDRGLEELKNFKDYNLSLQKQNAEYAQMLKEFQQNVKNIVEVLTGEWSRRQADLLTDLALKCREINQRTQPNLKSEAQNEQMKVSYAASSSSSSSQLDSEVHTQLPHLFMCPISRQIMQDPHVASDGYTYDRSNIQKWLNEGHDSSPWTNLKLPNSRLIPNHCLRSAIQDWQQQNN